ncbi:hypothetical protein [Rhodococcus koreensis]
MTSLSAPNVLARLLGLVTPGLVAGEAHVHVRLPGGEFEEIPISSRGGCRHADTGNATTRTVPQRSATVLDENAKVRPRRTQGAAQSYGHAADPADPGRELAGRNVRPPRRRDACAYSGWDGIRRECAGLRQPDLTTEDGAFIVSARLPSPDPNRSARNLRDQPTRPPSGGEKTGLMTGHRRWTSLPPHRTPTPPSAEDLYDDLRERLPAELRDQPDDQIPRLWAAWSEARSGYDAGHLIRTFQLAPALAHRLVDLAHERQS